MSAEAPSGSAPAQNAGRASAAQSGPDPLVGRVINDRYRIVSLIARGGMGKVYRAVQAPLGREVALKVLNPNYSGDADPEFHKRFFLEASITAKLTHPNTVSIFDYGRTDDDVYYIVMELLEGKTLHRALREVGRFDAGRALHVARQICRSLREAHSLGVIHRDLKPANVFLVKHGDETDFVKVLDFGLVKNLEEKGEDLTQTGLFMGSPKYMSPEQIRGEKVDGRADIYALGVILYEMLTGKVPFDRPNSVNILMAHVHEPPPAMREIDPNLEVSPVLEQIVMKMLAKKPEDRFASMEELLVALKQVGTDGQLAVSASRELSGEFANPLRTGPFAAVGGTGDPLATTTSLRSPTPSAPPSVAPGGPEPATQGASSVERPTRHTLPLVVAAVSLVVLGAVGVAAWLGGEGGEVSRAGGAAATGRATSSVTTPPATGPSAGTLAPGTSTEASETAASDDGAAVSAEPALARTRVSLRSDPPGALVTVHTADGQRRQYGPTPAEVEWSGADAARGREVTFVFELAGYRDHSVTRTIAGDTLQVSAALEAAPPARPFRPRPPRRDPSTDPGGAVGPIKGYKLDPY